uniref:Uncharacterized protein n=1 Tax=Anguilla anguilla TaxID=7936 RepID=A0A0E9RH44_ANGAN
MLNLTGSVLC